MRIVGGYSQFCSQWSQILPEIFMHDTGVAKLGFDGSKLWKHFTQNHRVKHWPKRLGRVGTLQT